MCFFYVEAIKVRHKFNKEKNNIQRLYTSTLLAYKKKIHHLVLMGDI